MENVLVLGKIIYRERDLVFGIKREDRRKHVYIIGKTGTGKTTLLLNMIIQDIKNGEGLAFFDPHGDAVKILLNYIPNERIEDVIYLNPADFNHPFGFNALENVSYEKRHLVVSSILSVFKKIWVDAWSARMEYLLTNALLSLLEFPGATFLDINRLFSDDDFRKRVVSNLKDPVVKSFWEKEYEKYHLTFRTEAVAPIQNKTGQFINNPLIRNIIGQSKSSLNLREIMDERKILLVNLSIGEIGEESANLLGGLLIGKLYLTAMERVSIPEEERKDFYLYVDEFQNFATELFINILSEARKYRLNLILAHQYLDQVDEEIIKAVFGNVGTLIVFRIGAKDAQIFYEEFERKIPLENIINLQSYHGYIKLLVDGKPSPPFLFKTFPLEEPPTVNYVNEILAYNHLRYTLKREIIEARIRNIYSKKTDDKELICRLCGLKFISKDGIEICENCQKRSSGGISLKNLKEKNFKVEFKKEAKKQKVDLDSILEKLENESD